jgi:hypothetical protein
MKDNLAITCDDSKPSRRFWDRAQKLDFEDQVERLCHVNGGCRPPNWLTESDS